MNDLADPRKKYYYRTFKGKRIRAKMPKRRRKAGRKVVRRGRRGMTAPLGGQRFRVKRIGDCTMLAPQLFSCRVEVGKKGKKIPGYKMPQHQATVGHQSTAGWEARMRRGRGRRGRR